MDDDSLKVAVIIGPHGIKGEVKLLPLVDDASLLFTGHLQHKSLPTPLKLTRKGVAKKHLICAIEGVTDRNQAESLKSTSLYLPAASLPPLEDEEYYARHLIGLKVRSPSGEELGEIIELNNYGAGDLLEVRLTDGSTELYPFTEAFFPVIDVNKGYAELRLPDVI